MRSTILRIIRKTIEDLPDIHQEMRSLKVPGRETPLTGDIEALLATPAELLRHIGISRENTTAGEWQTFMLLSQKVLDGELEVGSKTGLSITAALGKDAPRVRKTISRYRERQRNR